jgi:rfaE bifunctional protein kinase chain/domain/rfaE bifunctional protein nucleotidyltransferase chain/domain
MVEKIFHDFESFKSIFSKIGNKKKIILCHGVYDLFHAGHLYSLKKAKEYGDILIVSLTSDRFVKKAPNRPFFKFDQRADVIAGLSVVDYIVKSNFETAVNVIKFIKPKFYFKGPDYKDLKKDITGNIYKEIKAIKSVGGKIIYGETLTFSSSKILNSVVMHDKDQLLMIKNIKKRYNFEYIENNIFKKIENENILVFGECIIDNYIFSKYLGISGKDQIQTFEKINEKSYAGGALATANNISSFSNNIKLVTIFGDNVSEVNFCKKNLKKNIKLKYFMRNNSPTITKTKIVDLDENKKVLGLYKFNDKEMSLIEYKKIYNLFKQNIKKASIVIITDYGHYLINDQIAKKIINTKKTLIVNTQINAANFGFHGISKYKGCECAVINELELRFETRDRKEKVSILLKKLAKKLKIKTLVVTCGNKGSYAYSNKLDKIVYCPAFATKVVDKIGAGDCFMSVFGIISKFSKDDLLLPMFIASIATSDIISGYGNQNRLNLNSLKKNIQYLLK